MCNQKVFNFLRVAIRFHGLTPVEKLTLVICAGFYERGEIGPLTLEELASRASLPKERITRSLPSLRRKLGRIKLASVLDVLEDAP